MEINKFKMVADFNIWSLSHDDEIYTITTEDGEELFDVIEEDFFTMVDEGVVNHEGFYYLLNHPTEEQIREYAARWGILWLTDDDVVETYYEHLRRFKLEIIYKIRDEIEKRGGTITFPIPYGLTENCERVLLHGISLCDFSPYLVFHLTEEDVEGDYLIDYNADELLGLFNAVRRPLIP